MPGVPMDGSPSTELEDRRPLAAESADTVFPEAIYTLTAPPQLPKLENATWLARVALDLALATGRPQERFED